MDPHYGLYLHIPFCHTRCVYCDFNTYVDLDDLQARYVAALTREIQLVGAGAQQAARPAPAKTIFFGGGTPTALPPEALVGLVQACHAAFALAPDAEVTVEANPGTVTLDYLRTLRAEGINRLSFGVQSFHDDELRFLGRLHDAATARTAVALARQAGFDNLSLDLIFGLPGQSLARWQATLEATLALAPEHLSLYSLIVEPGTPLHQWVRRGQVQTPDEDLAAEMYEHSIARLAQAGYAHYEVSNWARTLPALASHHNLIYWRNQSYFGLGAGAHSYAAGRRYANLKRPERYIQAVEQYQPAADGIPAPAVDPTTIEIRDQQDAIEEQMMLGLRLVQEGIELATFQARFGQPLQAIYPEPLARLQKQGLLTLTPDRLTLTPRGLMLANQVVSQFFR
jgi:oxygen-independent coproporphyrinogen-3 oxidase